VAARAVFAALSSALRGGFTQFAQISSESDDSNRSDLPMSSTDTDQSNGYASRGQVQLSNSEVTRLVAAGAITQGEQFRRYVITHYRFPHQATAPELGLDPEIVLRVCEHIESEFKRNTWAWIWSMWPSNREEIIREKYLHYFSADKYDPVTVRNVFIKHQPIDNLPRLDQNVVVYKGFRPFVGAGVYLGGWSFAVDIGPYYDDVTHETITPDQFELTKMYSAIADHLAGLQFDNIELRDYVFAYGSDIRTRSELLPRHDSRPLQRVDEAILDRYIDSNEWGIRYYKWIILHDWDGEIVLSFFLRISKRGVRNLFLEFNTYLMPPLHESLHTVDRVIETMEERNDRIAAQRKSSPIITQKSFEELVVNGSKRQMEELQKKLDGNLRYNYGVAQSIRERVAANNYTRFFQLMDKEMYVKIIEKEIFRAINTFLEQRHVNVSELKSKQSFIINQGIMVQGSVTGDSIAIGTGAQVSNQSGTSVGSNRVVGNETK
jgi:hypothetical protein